MKTTICLFVTLFLGGCAGLAMDRLRSDDNASGAFCIEGSGPPLTGSGHVAAGHTNDGFKGQITITPDCGISITSE